MPSMVPATTNSGVPTPAPDVKVPLLCSDNDPLLCSDQLACTDTGAMSAAPVGTGSMVAA